MAKASRRLLSTITKFFHMRLAMLFRIGGAGLELLCLKSSLFRCARRDLGLYSANCLRGAPRLWLGTPSML